MSLFRWRTGLLVLGTGLLLMGCQGVQPGKSPTVEFVVPISVKSAYSRAIEQSKYCLVTHDRFPLTATLAPDEKSANVRVNMNLAGTLLSDVQIRAQGPSQSQVTVMMWGVDVWDATAVSAMRAAIEFGVPSCTNYFPSADSKKKR